MKMVFTGPESSGKTAGAEWLSTYYQIALVPEIAREYLNNIQLPYTKDDVTEIGIVQHKMEQTAAQIHQNIICDTDLLTIIIWQEEKYGKAEPRFYNDWENDKVDLYFLCTPDIPWEYDPLRENPYDRDRLFMVYKQWLEAFNKPFIVLSGNECERQNAMHQVMKQYNIELPK